MNTPKTRFVEYENTKIAYTIQGPETGVPVVLQHGWTSNKESWTDYVSVLIGEGYRCVSIDSLGHGESDKPTEASYYAREKRAAQVAAILDKEDIERAHFAGYSMGGWIACCMAEFQAERLLSLMIGGHCPETGTNEEAAQEYSFEQILKAMDFDWPEEIVPAMRHTFEFLEDVSGHEAAVAGAGVPVLLWKGQEEPVICKKGESMAKHNGWRFFSVEGDHMQAAMDHESVLPHLLDFLRSA